ncbi:MAG TPA: hypothetical protein VNU68_27355 [Verrucomicrobiae bacterium]|nr:hypothetical protein [Verrucomicrobiae bacterium]
MVDNKIFIGGVFSSIGGIAATNLAQWDGTNWASVGVGISQGVVYALTADREGLVVGGSFRQVGDVVVNNVARWDGTNWSALGEGVNQTVFALASDSEYLYAGGRFTIAGSSVVGKVARWDGTNWSGLGSGIVTVDGVGTIDSLATGRGSLYAGGRFRVAGGAAATNIARWDGVAWSPLGYGLRLVDFPGSENGAVRALAFHDGILYAGGYFRLAGSIAATNITAWNGSDWLECGGGANNLGEVDSLAVVGGDLFVGGGFSDIGGVPASRVARWTGANWLALGTGVSASGGLRGTVFGLASTGSELVAVGVFDTAGGSPSTNIALWHIPHALTMRRSESEVRLSWPETGSNFVLESSAALGPEIANWGMVPQEPTLEKPIRQVGEWVVMEPLGLTDQFYRLRRR